MPTASSTLLAIAASESLDRGYLWLCHQRKDYPANSDIWHFRHHWAENKYAITQELLTGRYQFTPQQRITLKNGSTIHLWSSKDSLVMKAMALTLGSQWPISPRCTHVKGHGGLKDAVRWRQRKLPRFSFVFRSDVTGYYANIDQTILLEQLDKLVPQRDVMRLLAQVIQRTVEWGGAFKDIRRGIGRGSPLSPLFAAVYLKPLDDVMEREIKKQGIAYVRYMDDWIVLPPAATNSGAICA